MENGQQLIKWREDTPGCQNVIHLNNAGASLMPSSVVSAITSYIQLEAEIGGYEAAEQKAKEIDKFYSLAANLLNCEPRNIAYTTNATDSFSRALSSVNFKHGDVILTTEVDYISNQILFLLYEKRFGIRIERIPGTSEGAYDLELAEQFIKKLNPKLVSITHIPTNSGLIQDINYLGELCNKYDVWYLVDACQSIGQLSLDVKKIKCDFLSVTCRKFLRGPRGAGFLFVSDKALDQNLAPLSLDMRGAHWISQNKYSLVESAKRFEDWEFAYALVAGTNEALQYLLNIGPGIVEEKLRKIADYSRKKLANTEQYRLLDRGNDLCAIVTLQFAQASESKIKILLKSHKINHSMLHRSSAVIDFDKKGVSWALRISPHYYNTKDEIDYLVSVLSDLKAK